jgi:hypothetical protein
MKRIMILMCLAACGTHSSDSSSAGKSSQKPDLRAAPTPLRKLQGAEVPTMFAQLRMLEEQYKTENGVYLATGGEADVWPAQPSPTEVMIDASAPDSWRKLGVTSEMPIHCGYVVVAPPQDFGETGQTLFASMQPPNHAWYYAIAKCGSKVYTISSETNTTTTTNK